jgi:hypothetical protein
MMGTRYFFAAILVLSGALCVGAAAISGARLDSAYVAWSAARTPDTAATEGAVSPRQRFPQSALAGAPISILAPVLIWLAVGIGVILVLLGLWAGLHDVWQQRTSDTGGSVST